ncbi:hypothetical protein COB55_05120 [Candidatus Wolfebacteria bacterium]|nr:MAG: hypothetical protein COB55_05120 [Candidatus Wolfebacteria bacterium]
MDTKKVIQELNVLFEKKGWKLFPKENEVPDNEIGDFFWGVVIYKDKELDIQRNYIPYDKHLDKFTLRGLDKYVIDFIEPICKKHNIKFVEFITNGEQESRNKITL